MRTLATTALALGFVGAMTVTAPGPAKAQGIYYYGPGVSVRIGHPRYYSQRRHYYRNYGYYRSYGYYGSPYAYYGGGGGCRYGYTVQDGYCKPYRGY